MNDDRESSGWQSANAWRHVGAERQQVEECIAEEVPVALVYNGISQAVMLASPTDLEDFALGFSLSEGVIARSSDLYVVEIVHTPAGIELQLEIASQAFQGLKATRRQLAGRTGCGLCGLESLQQAMRPVPQVANTGWQIAPSVLEHAMMQLPDLQVLHQTTGGVHAAAWVDLAGNIRLIREDVGRHNALDKLLGALWKQAGWCPADGFLFLTSRASHELVYKAAFAGIELVAAVSAPTSLALRHAHKAGMTLIGWVRQARFTVYCGEGRLNPNFDCG
ncbi:MAG: formate dehydrogenase accessory sulfurtransferase FdhD [Thiothrix sp.]